MLRAAFSSFKPSFSSFSTMAHTKPCKLALIQLAVSADKDANLANARTHVLEAASKGANLIVLPVTLPPFYSLFRPPPTPPRYLFLFANVAYTYSHTYADPFYSTLFFFWESRSASIRLMAPVTSPNTPRHLRTVLLSSHSPPWPKYAQDLYTTLLSHYAANLCIERSMALIHWRATTVPFVQIPPS